MLLSELLQKFKENDGKAVKIDEDLEISSRKMCLFLADIIAIVKKANQDKSNIEII